MYSYTSQEHEEWVAKITRMFGEIAEITEDFRWTNSIIEAKVVKTKFCTITLKLYFVKNVEVNEEYGSIMCIYGPLTEIRKFQSYGVYWWDNAIKVFQDMINNLDYSSFESVCLYFSKLWPKNESDTTICVAFFVFLHKSFVCLISIYQNEIIYRWSWEMTISMTYAHRNSFAIKEI